MDEQALWDSLSNDLNKQGLSIAEFVVKQNKDIVRQVIEDGDVVLLRMLRKGYEECLKMLDEIKGE